MQINYTIPAHLIWTMEGTDTDKYVAGLLEKAGGFQVIRECCSCKGSSAEIHLRVLGVINIPDSDVTLCVESFSTGAFAIRGTNLQRMEQVKNVLPK